MQRYVCIHGHFYQPPRENPSTGEVDKEKSAAPYPDWNERITVECYRPNLAAPILDAQGHVIKKIRTYGRMSFDFGPTLLNWLERHAPDVYQGVLDADLESRERFGGHGSAMATGYNHMILPLADIRDKETQILWGLRDFEHRFGRRSEGFWLPETAVDLESLEILAEHLVRFIILAPHQARAVHKIDDHYWFDVPAGELDTSMPYFINLPSGHRLAVFFYDEPISRAVAFEGLLHSGDILADRIVQAFSDDRSWPQLVSLATDGETFGHHHKFGEMALAYALEKLEQDRLAKLVNFGAFLDICEPTHEVEILENTSWSCPHGVERWRSDCGCRAGTHPAASQSWRGPLREALDGLRDRIRPLFESTAGDCLKDPWDGREDYIDLILDPSKESADRYFDKHSLRGLSDSEKKKVLTLMEMQRHLMFMYTSCGWFFDDPLEIGTQIVLRQAARAVELAKNLFHEDLHEPLQQFERV